MATLELANIVKTFDRTKVLHGIDLAVSHGEFVVFVGPSGCGKSTLLRVIAGLETPSAGDIRIDGQVVNDIGAAQRGCAMVFQSYALYPHMSVYDNMAFGLENLQVPRPQIQAKVQDAARLLRLEDLLQRKPTQLSGGQRQRVAIGRAIVRDPRLFLFDEPLSNLDAELRVSMRAELRELHARLGATMVYVTHDQVEAMTLADKIVVLREGRVEQVGRPLDLYAHPANQFVAGFIGSPKMNFLPVQAVASGGAMLRVALEDGTQLQCACSEAVTPGTALAFGVRPEHLQVVPVADAVLRAEVLVAERLGGETYFHLRLAGRSAIARVTGDSRVAIGDAVGLAFDPAPAHAFGPDGRRLV